MTAARDDTMYIGSDTMYSIHEPLYIAPVDIQQPLYRRYYVYSGC